VTRTNWCRVLPTGARFTILSPLPVEHVRERLSDAIGPMPTSLFHRHRLPFTGTIRGDSFDMVRTVRGRNSFRPWIRGTIEAAAPGTRLHGTMRLHEAVLAIMATFTVLPSLVFLRLAYEGVRSGHVDRAAPIALAVVLFMLAMTLGGFALESRLALRELAAVVEASHSELR